MDLDKDIDESALDATEADNQLTTVADRPDFSAGGAEAITGKMKSALQIVNDDVDDVETLDSTETKRHPSGEAKRGECMGELDIKLGQDKSFGKSSRIRVLGRA